MALLSKRISNVIAFGGTLTISMRPEILDIDADAGSKVVIKVVEKEGKKKFIVIEVLKEL